MDTIKNYLDNMFSTLPQSEEIQRAKEELLSNMEDKYNELKQSGKSENEAIGIVISEFGNIDEIIRAFNLPTFQSVTDTDTPEDYPLVTRTEATNFLHAGKVYGNLIGIGAFLCIMAPALLILLSSFSDTKHLPEYTGELYMIPFFILIAIAVGLFIYSGFRLEKYEYMKQPIRLEIGLRSELAAGKERFMPIFATHIIVGVCMCILSPVTFFFHTSYNERHMILPNINLAFLLLFIAIAVFLFIRSGLLLDHYRMLLQEKEFTVSSKLKEKSLQRISSVFWSIIVAIYLLWSFVTGDWGFTWIIWPVTGILFGAFTGIYKAVRNID